MNKKLISVLTAAALTIGASSAVFADKQNSEPEVLVNGSQIQFEDQSALIKDGRTLVPVRGVFEALGWNVYWSQEKLMVTIDTADNRHRVQLFIGEKNMNLVEFNNILNPDISTVELDVAPEVINDRTMVPLRAISEALNANVDWDDENYTVIINTLEETDPQEDTRPALSLSSALTGAVKAGDEFDIYINVAFNELKGKQFVSGLTAELEYEPSKFELLSASLCSDSSATGVLNTSFTDHSAKAVYVTIDDDNALKEDGPAMKITVKSLTGEAGTFRLVDSYHSRLGFNTALLMSDFEKKDSELFEGAKMLKIDTSALTVGE